MKSLMLGNAAIARGLYEAGCTYISSYPGTPSTEITECAAEYTQMQAEWAPNEKVALESAIGASIVGARSFSAMKHVGLNVASDPLYSISYGGVNGGLVIAVADDPGMHSSQDEQDSRHHAIAAKIPMLEPADSQECKDYTKLAFELSEKYDTPILLRLSTRISHSQSAVTTDDRQEVALKDYVKQPSKYVLIPANSKLRHVEVEKRMAEFNVPQLLKIIEGDKAIGIVSSGIAFQYAQEALGDKASYLKLGVVNPLPMDDIKKFAATVDKLYIIEELDPIIEQQVKAAGIKVDGGKELFSLLGEYTSAMIAKALLNVEMPTYSAMPVPPRPPVLCPGCPHRATFYTLSKLKLTVAGDIGCYTLGVAPPLAAIDTTIDMGASIGAIHGMNMARKGFDKHTVAVIGDSTFIHSGITALINIVYNRSASTVLILDNSITGMTGHQQNPSTGLTLKNKPTHALNFEALCTAIGIESVSTVDPYDFELFEKLLKASLNSSKPAVIIVKRPCVLLKSVKLQAPLMVDTKNCKKCKQCMKLGCPAINFGDTAHIDHTLCVGCGLCAKVCKYDCIGGIHNENN